jgi:hypothetical protein
MEERIKYLLHRLAIAQSNEEKENLVRLELRSQDWSTKLACKDAVEYLPLCGPAQSSLNTIDRVEALFAIMDCKGGLE